MNDNEFDSNVMAVAEFCEKLGMNPMQMAVVCLYIVNATMKYPGATDKDREQLTKLMRLMTTTEMIQ